MFKFKVGDKVSVDPQAIYDRYALVPNLLFLVREDKNYNATVTYKRTTILGTKTTPSVYDYIVAFDVAPDLANLVFSEDELNLVVKSEVAQLDKLIENAEANLKALREHRERIVNSQ